MPSKKSVTLLTKLQGVRQKPKALQPGNWILQTPQEHRRRSPMEIIHLLQRHSHPKRRLQASSPLSTAPMLAFSSLRKISLRKLGINPFLSRQYSPPPYCHNLLIKAPQSPACPSQRIVRLRLPFVQRMLLLIICVASSGVLYMTSRNAAHLRLAHSKSRYPGIVEMF